MALNQALIAELQQEAANTHKLLERVPAEHMDWQPHAKSMSLTRLATHIAELPGWITMALNTHELDLGARDYKPNMAKTAEELIAIHNKNVAGAKEALSNATDEQLAEPWTLRQGDHVIFTLPKVAVIRSAAMNHMIHHRGQLSVFLRLLDVPLPGIYGPTRDEMDMMAAAQN
jgi:uncharacterized damage-inducible protein DinB